MARSGAGSQQPRQPREDTNLGLAEDHLHVIANQPVRDTVAHGFHVHQWHRAPPGAGVACRVSASAGWRDLSVCRSSRPNRTAGASWVVQWIRWSASTIHSARYASSAAKLSKRRPARALRFTYSTPDSGLPLVRGPVRLASSWLRLPVATEGRMGGVEGDRSQAGFDSLPGRHQPRHGPSGIRRGLVSAGDSVLRQRGLGSCRLLCRVLEEPGTSRRRALHCKTTETLSSGNWW